MVAARHEAGCHVLTFGFVLGELVRRATGRTLSAALREAITVPLGVADELHFGVPPTCWRRLPPRVPRAPCLRRPSQGRRVTARSRAACSRLPH
jgi:CubicO group peptidase (beta-lactamase class C family)